MKIQKGITSLIISSFIAVPASASVIVGITSIVLTPDTGSFAGPVNQTIQDDQGSIEASSWFNGSGLQSSLANGDIVPEVLPLHQSGRNFAGNADNPGFQSARLRSATVPFAADTSLVFSLTAPTNGLNGLLLWNHTEANGNAALVSSRGFASATAEFSTDGVTFFGSESLTFAQAQTSITNGSFEVMGQTITFSQTYDNVNFVRFSDIATFNGPLESGESLASVAEIRFTADAIPEPSVALLGGIGLLGLLRRRRI